MEFKLKEIGIIHTPFREDCDVPFQGSLSNAEGTLEVYPEYVEGLRDIEGLSHLIVLFVFDRAAGFSLSVQTPWSEKPKGIFSTRASRRPNPIGMSVLKLLNVDGNLVRVKGVDMFDKTPFIDIKPYVPEIDARTDVKRGWFSEIFKWPAP